MFRWRSCPGSSSDEVCVRVRAESSVVQILYRGFTSPSMPCIQLAPKPTVQCTFRSLPLSSTDGNRFRVSFPHFTLPPIFPEASNTIQGIFFSYKALAAAIPLNPAPITMTSPRPSAIADVIGQVRREKCNWQLEIFVKFSRTIYIISGVIDVLKFMMFSRIMIIFVNV